MACKVVMESLTQLPSTLFFCYLWNTALICMMVTDSSVFRPEKRGGRHSYYKLVLTFHSHLIGQNFVSWPLPQCKGVWEMWFLARVAASQVSILQLQRKGYQETAYLPWVIGGNTIKCLVSASVGPPLQLPQGRKSKWKLRGSLPGLCRARNCTDFDEQSSESLFLESILSPLIINKAC